MPRSRPDLAQRNRESATHGHTREGVPASPTYTSWRAMMQRSHSGSSKDAVRYLARGITVCDRWLSFETFLADMGERPAGTTLDRINNAKGYEPGNCRWATQRVQSQNKTTARLVTANGETLNVAEWARRMGVSRQVIRHRLEAGWKPELAVTLPRFAINRWNHP